MDRSANMRAIRSKGMRPELAVRRLVHRLGYRFRLHRTTFPENLIWCLRGGKVIFVHGCFWHSHDCKIAHVPKSNQDYWAPKLQRNQMRDGKNLRSFGNRGLEGDGSLGMRNARRGGSEEAP